MDGNENVQSSGKESHAITGSIQGLESRSLLFRTDVQANVEATEEAWTGEAEDIAKAVQRTQDNDITEVVEEVQSTGSDILKPTEDLQRAEVEIIGSATEDAEREEEDIIEATENVQRADESISAATNNVQGAEENVSVATEDVQRTEEDINEPIKDVQGAEANISDDSEDAQEVGNDCYGKMISQQALENRNPSVDTEHQGNLKVTEEFEAEQEDIPMTNSEQLKEVHQTYRKMECDRRAYHISTEGIMRQQEALLDNMKSENYAFKEMVDAYVIKDYQQQMNYLLEQADKLQSMVEIETRRVKDLDNFIAELASREMDAKRATGGCKAGWEKHKSTQIQIQITENRLEKGPSGKKTLKDQCVIVGSDYQQWIEMKALEDIQDVLKTDDVQDILPSLLGACEQDANISENIDNLMQEISELDSTLLENIHAIPTIKGETKRSFECQKLQMDKMSRALLESLKYLCLDDAMYFPMVKGLKKQIILLFKEAGCHIGDEDLDLEDQSTLDLAIKKWFNKLEQFVDQISN